MTNIKKLLGANIRYFRTNLSTSQAELAENIGMATNYLGLIECGKKFPSADMIERIAAAMGKDSVDLFTLIPIQHEWKENILSKIDVLINDEIRTLQDKT